MPAQTPSLSLRLGAVYLALQAAGAAIWWMVLWVYPASRALFRPVNAPDASLFSFFAPDLVFFVGAALWASVFLWRGAKRRALIPLALHVGAASYAALYCLQQWLMSGEAPLAALFMAPALVVGPLLLWICSRA